MTSEALAGEKTLNDETRKVDFVGVDALYDEMRTWHVNTGEQVIHAKRMPGRFRTLKWITSSVWLLFLFGPYLRWGERQAVLFDIPDRQFHIFGLTVLPQDVWMLSLVLLFFAISLAVVTAVAGRVFCGYFCFQTVWTDVFTWIEEKLEGEPRKRHKLDQAPWDAYKIRIKLIKHTLWMLTGVLTGISFAAWFTDAYDLWRNVFTLQAAPAAWITIAMFTGGTYLFAGFMREQVCFWLCPYARIQGVMYDAETILPTYDFVRGEPRGKLKKGEAAATQGDCIDCNQCVAVCPTGIDIRGGQQEGCITCALCIDACDAVMDKIGKPKGLIRYASYKEIHGEPVKPLFLRPRVLVYLTIILASLVGVIYGMTTIAGIELKVLHERQPLFVLLSNGSIQNKYDLKILNKTAEDIQVTVTAKGITGLELVGGDAVVEAPRGKVTAYTVFLRVPNKNLEAEVTPVYFAVKDNNNPQVSAEYESMFMAPRR